MFTPLQRILVPTDFSPHAEQALDAARNLARHVDAELHVLHVRELVDGIHLEQRHKDRIEELLQLAERSSEEALSREAAATEKVEVHPHLVRGVSPAEAIVATCVELSCGLIVMGTHGRRGLKRFILGSVTEEVVRTSDEPVLIVPPQSVGGDHSMTSIVVAVDFSAPATAAVQHAAGWARALGARMTLLHVIEPTVYPEFYAVDVLPEDTLRSVDQRAIESLEAFIPEHLEGLEASATVVVGRAAEEIIKQADSAGHDLIVMGKRGLSDLESILVGSVAESVLRRSPVPVLTVRE